MLQILCINLCVIIAKPGIKQQHPGNNCGVVYVKEICNYKWEYISKKYVFSHCIICSAESLAGCDFYLLQIKISSRKLHHKHPLHKTRKWFSLCFAKYSLYREMSKMKFVDLYFISCTNYIYVYDKKIYKLNFIFMWLYWTMQV
jgi:hypothetical protein